MSKNIMILLSLSLLVLPFIPNSIAQQSTTKLTPTDDAFIVTNVNDPSDRMGLQSLNTGDYKFIKIGYAWNTTPIHEKIISAGVIKFDLTDLKSANITKANLMMYPFVANLTGLAREVEVVPMANANWTESKITFRNAPPILLTPIASATVSGAGSWIDWDLSDFVKKNIGSKISLEIFFKTMYPGSQENLAFYSKEADNQALAPYLEVSYIVPTATQPQLGQDYLLYIILGGLGAAGSAFAILRNRTLKKSKPGVITKASVTVSDEKYVNTRQQEHDVMPSGKKQDEISESMQCGRCGKTILRGFKVCPYCGNIRDVNFPL